MSKLTIRSFAKLNIALDVLDKRADGYHNIESVIQLICLRDRLTLARREDAVVEVRATDPGVPTGLGNLAYRAAVIFFEACGLKAGIDIEIEKLIPMEAGLGGGSSNGTATLAGLNELFGRPLAHRDLWRLAARLGSDAPFFLSGGAAFVSGRGDLVRDLPDFSLDYVVVKPAFGVSTGWAYGKLDAAERTPRHASRAVMDAILEGDRTRIVQNMANDFQFVVESAHPEIARIRTRLLSLGADGAMLAGSGSAVFGAFLDPVVCDRAYNEIKGEFPNVFRTRSAPRKESSPAEPACG
ncbi:MAG: 4-(cytidine 5'-diphospho)-2-C-methyl-D-erythritol kinase [Phycisphaerales bacterium]|nr:4-(cytidine 5'-diphospho)-2-C-methyl-D-erythritol kinase [Phycisphaerales bacterium]